jgi:hypothetical protein
VSVAARNVVSGRCADGGREKRAPAWMPWGGCDRMGRSCGGQGAKPPKGGGEQRCPGPGALQAEEDAATTAGHAAGDVEESMAKGLRLPAGRLAVQAEALEEGEQDLGGGGEHELQPDLVGGDPAEGDATQPGVLAAADTVFDAGLAAMASLKRGQVGAVLVGDEDLESGSPGGR